MTMGSMLIHQQLYGCLLTPVMTLVPSVARPTMDSTGNEFAARISLMLSVMASAVVWSRARTPRDRDFTAPSDPTYLSSNNLCLIKQCTCFYYKMLLEWANIEREMVANVTIVVNTMKNLHYSLLFQQGIITILAVKNKLHLL